MPTKKRKIVRSAYQIRTAKAEREAAARLMYLGHLFIKLMDLRAYCRMLERVSDIATCERRIELGVKRYAEFCKILRNLDKQAAKEFACFAPLPASTPVQTRRNLLSA